MTHAIPTKIIYFLAFFLTAFSTQHAVAEGNSCHNPVINKLAKSLGCSSDQESIVATMARILSCPPEHKNIIKALQHDMYESYGLQEEVNEEINLNVLLDNAIDNNDTVCTLATLFLGADINNTEIYNENYEEYLCPLTKTILTGSTNQFNLLMTLGANPSPNIDNTPLEAAIRSYQIYYVRKLYAAGALADKELIDIARTKAKEAPDNNNGRLVLKHLLATDTLIKAVLNNDLAMAKKAVKNGADIFVFQEGVLKDYPGQTYDLLEAAGVKGHSDVYKFLYKKMIKHQHFCPYNSLFYAVIHGKSEIIQYCISQGLDVNNIAFNPEEECFLGKALRGATDTAAEGKTRESRSLMKIAQQLLDAGADPFLVERSNAFGDIGDKEWAWLTNKKNILKLKHV